MRNVSAWDIATQDNLVVASLDVTSEDSVNNLVADVIRKEGNKICYFALVHTTSSKHQRCMDSITVLFVASSDPILHDKPKAESIF